MMMHRGKQGKNGRALRYSDLSLEGEGRQHQQGQPQVQNGVLHNGLRPYGGNKGNRGFPPSPYFFDKTEECHAQLHHDIQRLLEVAPKESLQSPEWVSTITNRPNHSGESPLFTHNLMAASRIEQQEGRQKFTKTQLNPNRCGKPVVRDGVMYYRGHTPHQYLTATPVCAKVTPNNGGSRLGRPTRTTLLRARQRCNSAPATTYETKREQQKRADQRTELKKQLTSQLNSSINNMLGVTVPPGESLHSFLTGARYNSADWIRSLSSSEEPRAHHVDEKSRKDYGVYLPRAHFGYKQSCFVIKKMKLKSRDGHLEHPQTETEPSVRRPYTASPPSPTPRPPPSTPPPSPPPSSPAPLKVSSSPQFRTLPPKSASPAPRGTSCLSFQPSQCPPMPKSRQAWGDPFKMDVDHVSDREAQSVTSQGAADEGGGVLKIKGVGFVGYTPKVARPMTSRSRPASSGRLALSADAAVAMVKGTSIYTSPVSACPPMLRRPQTATGGSQIPLNARELSEKMQAERFDEDHASEVLPKTSSGEGGRLASFAPPGGETEIDPEVMSAGSDDDGGPRVTSAPSSTPANTPSGTPRWGDSHTAEPHPEGMATESSEPEPGVEGESTALKAHGTNSIIMSQGRIRHKKGHVRFADQGHGTEHHNEQSEDDTEHKEQSEDGTEHKEQSEDGTEHKEQSEDDSEHKEQSEDGNVLSLTDDKSEPAGTEPVELSPKEDTSDSSVVETVERKHDGDWPQLEPARSDNDVTVTLEQQFGEGQYKTEATPSPQGSVVEDCHQAARSEVEEPPEGGSVRGNTEVHVSDDTDSHSVASDDQQFHVNVISVDITPKVSSDQVT